MTKIGIIIGSTRPGRIGEQVANWIYEHAQQHGGAEFQLLDLAEFNLPLYDEPVPPSFGPVYEHEHTKKWAEAIKPLDGFIFVTPEYNAATNSALKNAIDYLYTEWNNKAAGFVGYGSVGGVRAIENLRLICSGVQMAHVRSAVSLSLFTDFENFSVFKPGAHHEPSVKALIESVILWAEGMKTVREKLAVTA